MCAFNAGAVAIHYADDCAKAARRHGMGLDYRVRERAGNKWVVIFTSAGKEELAA